MRVAIWQTQQARGRKYCREQRRTQQAAAALLQYEPDFDERVAASAVRLGYRQALDADLLGHRRPDGRPGGEERPRDPAELDLLVR